MRTGPLIALFLSCLLTACPGDADRSPLKLAGDFSSTISNIENLRDVREDATQQASFVEKVARPNPNPPFHLYGPFCNGFEGTGDRQLRLV